MNNLKIVLFPYCWLKGELESIWYGIPLDGHDYKIIKTRKSALRIIDTLKCQVCGYESEAWEYLNKEEE